MANMEPLYPNPGGPVDPEDLVGRRDELQRTHEAVAHGGAYVTGERRMGKTSLLAKLESELVAAGRTVLRISAETSSPDVFAQRLVVELRKNHVLSPQVKRWEKEIEGSVGLAIGQTGFKLTGKAKRAADEPREIDVIELLASACERDGAVLIVDEVTVLCSALGPDAALELLRGLRAERQGDQRIQLVLSGSIGLHHAVPDTQPINDLWRVEVGPLALPEAEELTQRLLLGIGMSCDGAMVADIVTVTSGVPFYIQAVVDRLRSQPTRPVADIVERCIIENEWHTQHYVKRVEDYYGRDSAPVALALLDEFASASPSGLTIEQVQSRVGASLDHAPSRDVLIDLLQKLEMDHYLIREGDVDRMSSPLLATIWRVHRRLG